MKIFKSRLFLCLLTAIICISGTVLADNILEAKNVLFSSNNPEFKAKNVEDALNELYGKAIPTTRDFAYTKEVTVNSITIDITSEDEFYGYYCSISGMVKNASDGKCILTDLLPGTDYEVSISGIDKDGNVRVKKEIIHTTDVQLVKVFNASNDCVKSGNTCSSSDISNGVSLDVRVRDGEEPLTYGYHVLRDDGKKLVLIKDTALIYSIWGNNGTPKVMIDNVRNASNDWNELLTMEFSMNGTSSSEANYCDSNRSCSKITTYPEEPIIAKSRPIRAQELFGFCGKNDFCWPGWVSGIFGRLFSSNPNDYERAWTMTTSSTPLMVIDNQISTRDNRDANNKVITVIEVNKAYLEFEE